jgi:steroid 5-alpha reductase family enzyme
MLSDERWPLMNVFPDFGSLSGIGDIKVVIGAMLTIILIVAVLMIIVSAIIWAIATSIGNPGAATKARAGVFVALGAAVLAGGGVTWMNWLIQLGEQL